MPDERAAMDRLGRYWDEVARGGPARPRDLDPTLVAVLRRFQQLGTAPPPAGARERVWRDVQLHSRPPRTRREGPVHQAGVLEIPRPPMGRNGRRPEAALRWPAMRFPAERRRWALAQLATAALVLMTLAAGYVAFGRLRGGSGAQPPRIPAVVATPTAPAGAVEALWEYKPSVDDPDLLSHAYGLAIDPQGNLWVADGNHDRFQILAPDGTHLETWGTSGAGEGQFEFYAMESGFGVGYGDVAFDGAGNVYVLDTGNHRVQKFAPDRSFLLAWGSKGEDDGQFIAAGGIVVGPDGVVYVSDEQRGDVQRFDADGRFLGTTGPLLTDGRRVLPSGLAVASDGTIWIADFVNHQVQHFSPAGELLAAWGRPGTRTGEMIAPGDVALDAAGRVYVIEDGNPRLQVFSPDGQSLATTEVAYGELGYLSSGDGIAIDDVGVVYVSDRDSVQAFRLLPPEGGG